MKKADFWKHIELSKRSDPREHEERLVNRLSKLSPSEILQFAKWWISVHEFVEDYEGAFGKSFGLASDDPEVMPKGKRWDFDNDDAMQKRYPRLYKKFGDC